jgi:MFS family permease
MSREIAETPKLRERRPLGRGGFVGVLANQAFLRLWLAQALSQTAQQTINFTLLIQVRRIVEASGTGGANTAVAVLILTFATPPIFFSALAGVVVDRSDKRLIMAAVNLGRACCIAGYLFLSPEWPLYATLLYIYALCFTFSSVGQFFGPSEGSTIPLLVSREQLISANALFSLTFIGSQLLGFVTLGPLLTALLGLRTVYIVVVVLYLFCMGLILSLPRLPRARREETGEERRTIRGDLREVVQYLGRDALLRKAIAYLTIANSAFLMIASLAPEFVVDALKLSTERLATVITPAGLGMVVGVITVGRLGRRLDRETLVDRALIVIGVILLLFATVPPFLTSRGGVVAGTTLSPAVLLAMILAAGLGIANAFIIVPSQTMLQERSNEQIRARVLSAFFTTSNAVALVPILFAGVLGDLFGVVRVLAAIALLTLAGGLLAEWARRHRQPRQVAGR